MSTLREALTAAIDKGEIEPSEDAPEVEAEAAPEGEAEPVEAAPAEEVLEAEEPADKGSRDEKGRFRGKPGEQAEKPAIDAKAKPQAATEQVKPQVDPNAPAAAPFKAPPSWKAGAREALANLPPAVRDVIAAEGIRLDGEVRKVMQEAAGARQFASAFQQTLAPYEAMIRAEQRGRNYNPIEVVGSLLGTAAALRTGAPAHKADLVAELIQTYGVDVGQLDAALTKRLGGASAPDVASHATAQQPYRDPRVDELMDRLHNGQREQENRVYQQGHTQVQQFAQAHEFFDDVRESMGDLMAGATQRGREMTLDEAYRRACAADDQVSGITRQRQDAISIKEKAAATKRARAAGSSVRSNPTGANTAPAADSRRSDLTAAFDEVEGR